MFTIFFFCLSSHTAMACSFYIYCRNEKIIKWGNRKSQCFSICLEFVNVRFSIFLYANMALLKLLSLLLDCQIDHGAHIPKHTNILFCVLSIFCYVFVLEANEFVHNIVQHLIEPLGAKNNICSTIASENKVDTVNYFSLFLSLFFVRFENTPTSMAVENQ